MVECRPVPKTVIRPYDAIWRCAGRCTFHSGDCTRYRSKSEGRGCAEGGSETERSGRSGKSSRSGRCGSPSPANKARHSDYQGSNDDTGQRGRERGGIDDRDTEARPNRGRHGGLSAGLPDTAIIPILAGDGEELVLELTVMSSQGRHGYWRSCIIYNAWPGVIPS